jgi:hypothetical protein
LLRGVSSQSHSGAGTRPRNSNCDTLTVEALVDICEDMMFFFLLGLESSLYLQIYTFESSLAEIMYLPFAAEQAEIWLLVFRNPEK